MRDDPEGLVEFRFGGESYRAFFGFRAIKEVEAHYDLPFFQALQQAMPALSVEDAGDPAKVAAAGASIRMTELGRLFRFALLKHQPDIDEAKVDDMIDELGFEKVGKVLADAVSSALAQQEGDGGSPANPRKPRGK